VFVSEAILNRLLDLRRRRMWSQAEMASHLNLTEEAYRALEKGRTIRLEWDTILRLLRILSESGLSWDWFFFGGSASTAVSTPMSPERAESAPGTPEHQLHQALDRATARVITEAVQAPAPPPPAPRPAATVAAEGEGIPVLTAAELGRSLNVKTSKLTVRGVPRLRMDPPVANAVLGVLIEGDSLAPEYRDGDVVVCRSGSPEANKPGFLLLRDRECLLCLWHAESADRIRLIPVDPEQPVKTVNRADIVAVYAPVRRVEHAQLPAGIRSY